MKQIKFSDLNFVDGVAEIDLDNGVHVRINNNDEFIPFITYRSRNGIHYWPFGHDDEEDLVKDLNEWNNHSFAD